MADHRADRLLRVTARLAGALALATLAVACDTIDGPAGYVVVTQDKYDFQSCPEIVAARNGLVASEKQLSDLAAKAEASPGGFIVSATSYRTELTMVRGRLRAADRAIAQKGCDPAKTAPAAPPPAATAGSPQRSSR